MPTTYASHADVAREMLSLYPSGFLPTTQPTADEVTAEIASVTTSLRVRVLRATGTEPAASDDAAALVKRGVVAHVVAWVLRRAALGYPAAEVDQQAKPWESIYNEVKQEIAMLPDHYKASIVEQKRVGSTSSDYVRDPILADDALGRTDIF